VALLRTIPGLTVHVPGHADEVERLLREAIAGDHRVYVRLSEERNRVAHDPHRVVPLRDAGPGAPLLLAVGPSLDPALAATADLAISVAYAATVRPLDAAGLRRAATGSDVVLVEPYLSGSSLPEVMRALGDRPRRLLALGIEQVELRRYGTPAEHRAAHGLDAAGLRRSLHAFAADARAATP
jgi:transketolase